MANMIKCDIHKLNKLSEYSICDVPYPEDELNKWKNGDISSLLNSSAPQFIKDIIRHKKRESSSRFKSSWYFGEGYLSAILGPQVDKGWFSSFKWLYDAKWVTGENPEEENNRIIRELKREFYRDAIKGQIGLERLQEMQKVGRILGARAPDLWLIDSNKRHYFIEVKKEGDIPDSENKQLLGLALLEKYFKQSTYLVYLHPVARNILSDKKRGKWLEDYKSANREIEHYLSKMR